MQIGIDVRKALKPLKRSLTDLQAKQVPFATASALTAVAKLAQAAEKDALHSIFDRPTPFTVSSIAVRPARKTDLTAVVFVKDIAAQYLEPFEDGGRHFLGAKRALLGPRAQKTNQYGNLPRTTTARLRGKPNVFTGKIVTRSGKAISGIWQRGGPKAAKAGAMKLLIAFDDPQPVKQHLGFRARAERVVKANIKREFRRAMASALASAR